VPTADFTGVSGAGPYGDFVAQTDATVGAVLQALERLRVRAGERVFFLGKRGGRVRGGAVVKKTGTPARARKMFFVVSIYRGVFIYLI